MEVRQIVTRLDYVGELLQSLQHFASPNMHACCCDVCCHINSFQRSCIKRALQEIVSVSAHIRSKEHSPAMDGSKICSVTTISNPRESWGLGCEGNNIPYLQDVSYNNRAPENQHLDNLGVNRERSIPAPPMLSSTMKDSGFQATTISSDCSTSPIYDVEGAGDSHSVNRLSIIPSLGQDLIPGGAPQLTCKKKRQSFDQPMGVLNLREETQVRSFRVPEFSSAIHKTGRNSSPQDQPASMSDMIPITYGSSLGNPFKPQHIEVTKRTVASDTSNNTHEGLSTPSVVCPMTPSGPLASKNETPHSVTPCASGSYSNYSSVIVNTVIDLNTPTGPNSQILSAAPVAEENLHLQNDSVGESPCLSASRNEECAERKLPLSSIEKRLELQQESDKEHLKSMKTEAIPNIGSEENSNNIVKEIAKSKDILENADGTEFRLSQNMQEHLETSLANLSISSVNVEDKFSKLILHNDDKIISPSSCDATDSCARNFSQKVTISSSGHAGSIKDRTQTFCTKNTMLSYSQSAIPVVVTAGMVHGKLATVAKSENECPRSSLSEVPEKSNEGLCKTKEAIIGLLYDHTSDNDKLGPDSEIQTSQLFGTGTNQEMFTDTEVCEEQKVKMTDSALLEDNKEIQQRIVNAEQKLEGLVNSKPDIMNSDSADIFRIYEREVALDKILRKSFEDIDKENKESLLPGNIISSPPEKPSFSPNGKRKATKESYMFNTKCDLDCQENFSSPRKSKNRLSLYKNVSFPLSLEDPTLKCLSNLEILPRKSHSHDTLKQKYTDQRHSPPDAVIKASEVEIIDLNKEPTVLSSPLKRPVMGVRRSLNMCSFNRNNNTSNSTVQERIDNQLSAKSFPSLRKSLPLKIKTSCNRTKETPSRKNMGQVEILDDQISEKETTVEEAKSPQNKPAWGAPAIRSSQYLSHSQTKQFNTYATNEDRAESKLEVESPCGNTDTSTKGSVKPKIDSIDEVIPFKSSHKIECCIIQPSNLDPESPESMTRHHFHMIMESTEKGNHKTRPELNMSLPVSLIKTDANSQDSHFQKSEPIESYERNQSFPKSGCTSKQSSLLSPQQAYHNIQSSLDDRSKMVEKKSNFGDAERTPRNRRSIFGLSPPEQHQPLRKWSPSHEQVTKLPFQSSNNHNQNVDFSSPCYQKAPESSSSEERVSSGSEDGPAQPVSMYDHVAVGAIFTSDLWEALDVSVVLTQHQSSTPSVHEILFNTVTSSLCVVDKRRSGKIVSVNESFQLLIGLHEKVVGQRLLRFLKFYDSLDNLGRSCPQSFIRANGSILSVSGVLAMCVDSRGSECPVSVWMLPVVAQPHLAICVVDVVTPFISELSLLQGGQVVSLAESFEEMLGLDMDDPQRVQCGMSGVDVNKANIPQHAKLKTHDFALPVTVVIDNDDKEGPTEDGEVKVYHGNITLCGTLCGLLVVRPDGHIIFNDDYFRMFLGYSNLSEQADLWEILSEVSRIGQSGEETTLSICGENDILNSSGIQSHCLDFTLRDVSQLKTHKSGHKDGNRSRLCLPISCFQDEENSTFEEFSSEDHHEASYSETSNGDIKTEDFDDNRCFQDSEQRDKKHSDQPLESKKWTPPKMTSTPHKGKIRPEYIHQETESKALQAEMRALEHGIYRAMFLHASGEKFFGSFKVGSIMTSASCWQYCVWVYLHVNDGPEEESSSHSSVKSDCLGKRETRKRASEAYDSEDESDDEDKQVDGGMNRTVEPSLGQIIVDHAGLNQSHNAASGEEILDLETAIAGAFRKNYFVREALGQGSFGFVRRAMAIDCKKSVIVKFIKKHNMFTDGWTVNVDSGQRIPLEVAILKDLDSEYIIKVLDVYQNADFVQMVMEDFGNVDLFDFIDQVYLDDPLACHLFRQILWGVDYLHTNGIVHRDIKDENVVLRKDFRCKLIDFGSAVYLLPGEGRFTRFRGTMEYCSPEVFCGESYRGPELDMWALGVTLYTMVYRVNPFSVDDMPDTFSQLEFPDPDSDEDIIFNRDMLELLYGLLQRDPASRFTMTQALGSEWLRKIVDLSEYCWDDLFGEEMLQDHLINDISGYGSNLEDN